MIEWHKNLAEFTKGVYQNSVVFSSAVSILKRLPLPAFVASVVDKCNTKYVEQARHSGQLLIPGKLIGLNVTVAGFSLPTMIDEKKEPAETSEATGKSKDKTAKSTAAPATPDPVEFRPTLLILPIKYTVMEPVTLVSLTSALSKLGKAADALLTGQFEGKKNDEVHMGLPANMFNLPKEAVMTLCEKYLSKPSLRFKVYTDE